jgi:hypothetical protein
VKIFSGLLALAALVAMGYASQRWLRNHLSTTATGKAPSCLEIAGNTTSEDEGRTYIVGTIRNNCHRKFSKVTVLFQLDRPAGPFGDLPEAVAYAYSRDIHPGEVREFKTALPISRGSTYRFDGINAY